MIRCHITDGSSLGGVEPLLAAIARNDASHVDFIQIREKDLPAADLALLILRAVSLCRHARIIVNTRADAALACGAAGLHLPSNAPPPSLWRAIAPPGFLIGVSCHTPGELLRAEREGASYAFLSPVFRPLSKDGGLPAVGIEALRRACSAVNIPVLALGGVTAENAPLCVQAGAAGVAGISLFQQEPGAGARPRTSTLGGIV